MAYIGDNVSSTLLCYKKLTFAFTVGFLSVCSSMQGRVINLYASFKYALFAINICLWLCDCGWLSVYACLYIYILLFYIGEGLVCKFRYTFILFRYYLMSLNEPHHIVLYFYMEIDCYMQLIVCVGLLVNMVCLCLCRWSFNTS